MDKNIFLDEFWQNLVNFFSETNWKDFPIVKIILLIILLIYLFYTFLVFKQVKLMNEFLETKLSPITKLFAWIYLLYTLLAIVLVLAV